MRASMLALICALPLLSPAAIAQGPNAPAPQPASPVSEAMQRLWKGDYLWAIDALERAAFDSTGKVADDLSYQMWYQFRPMIGGHAPPPVLGPGAEGLAAGDAARLRAGKPYDALAVIRLAAAGTSIVILNEAHHSPRDRAFALQVARTLRPLGYTILAAETFSTNADPIPRMEGDGYPRLNSGGYLKDPVFADFVRQSLALGYRPAAYEQRPSQYPAGGGIPAREKAQADNLAAIIAANPGAKLLIYVGFSHAMEAPVGQGGEMLEWMAARLKKQTGIDPLTIDQANVGEASLHRWGREANAIVAPRIRTPAVVRLNGTAVNIGEFGHAVDLQVYHPVTRFVHGRPAWLKQLGRTPRPVPENLLPPSGRALVQAFLAREDKDAIPIDQVLVEVGKPVPYLMLPNQAVRYQVQIADREQAVK